MKNKIINFDKIKLQPDYLTKYGKQYHELYNPYLKCKNKPFKLTEFRSFCESNPDEEEIYYNDYEEVEYLSEDLFLFLTTLTLCFCLLAEFFFIFFSPSFSLTTSYTLLLTSFQESVLF